MGVQRNKSSNLQKKPKKFVIFLKFFLICLKSLKAFHVHNKNYVECVHIGHMHINSYLNLNLVRFLIFIFLFMF